MLSSQSSTQYGATIAPNPTEGAAPSNTSATPPTYSLEHPRTLGWFGTAALAMGGSNQSLFLLGGAAGLMATQGSASVPLLILGLLLSLAALPGWIELVLMWPNRVGGIAATCAEAFRPISPVLSNLTGVAYWWGWIPTCGLTAFLSAQAIHDWYLPSIPAKWLATLIIVVFTLVNLCGIKWVIRLAIPIATASGLLAFASTLIPIFAGQVNMAQATAFSLHSPFEGAFGSWTSAMSGLYLIGFAAPAFEQAACHVGEMRDPVRNLPRAMWASAGMAGVFFVALPLVWLGVLGQGTLTGELQNVLGPTFSPLVGGLGRAFAVWFMVFNMFHGTLAPLAGASRTLSQLSEDGLLPRFFALRNRNDVPFVTTILTALMALIFLISNDPPWVIAAANFCYLIGICLPSVAVWLLRRDDPNRERPYRASKMWINAGLGAAIVWGTSTVFGFEQYGLGAVIAGIALAYSGAALYSWRRWEDRKLDGRAAMHASLHTKLTGTMIAVLTLDALGYLLAVHHVDVRLVALRTALEDIFVVVALLTITVGLVLPGIITHAAEELADAANRLAKGTLSDFSRAMKALAAGDLDGAQARISTSPITVRTRDEIGVMADSFNTLQEKVIEAAHGLAGAREGLREARSALTDSNAALALRVEELRVSEERYALAARGANDGLWDWNFLTGEIFFAPRWKEMLGLGENGMGNRPDDWFALVHPDDAANLIEEVAAHVMGMTPHLESSYRLRHADGDYRWMLCRALAVRGNGQVLRLAGSQTDITKRREAEERLRFNASFDLLTGLPNRAVFMTRLDEAIARASNDETCQFAVLFLDLDGFKVINDSLGHMIGDQMLIAVARRLEGCMRTGDIVARLGGDEFTLLLDYKSADDVLHVASRLQELLRAPFHLSGYEVFTAASIGVALGSSGYQHAEDVLRDADIAMYEAKKRGRARTELFNITMHARALRRLELETQLRHAIEKDELCLHYQPIIDLETRQVRGFEALVRWNHPTRGMVAPNDFIPLAEETGLILPIGEWVLESACRQMCAWQKEFGDRLDTMSVNLSAKQFNGPGLVDLVARILLQTGLAPEFLKLEITETVIMENHESVAQMLTELRGLGVRLSMDDFGTGYSSLSYLHRFPLDVLKVDRSFVSRMEANSKEAEIVRTIVHLAHSLQLSVVAEGVETREQAVQLQALGCEYGQGYFFSKPLPVEDASAFLRRPQEQPVRCLPTVSPLIADLPMLN